MGAIQGSINQLLATVGIAARLSPKAEEEIAIKKGRAEALTRIATVESEAEPAAQKATEIIEKQKLYLTKSGKGDLRHTAEQFEGGEAELDKAIGLLQKAEALSPDPERQKLLDSAYVTKSQLRESALSKRKKANEQSAEDLQIKQEEKRKAEQFRQGKEVVNSLINWRNL